ncbi:CNT_collapsed_G0059010.mRNA.1.CDS.1 [Saccharomyces cerevisiae]|nr:CNT_collapsed_G0059010.mRNA.1.CDS.1 [Saccharomyces cerevisiae]
MVSRLRVIPSFNLKFNRWNSSVPESSKKELKTTDGNQESASKVSPVKEKEKVPFKVKMQKALRHYWDGSKLLGLEIKISSKLLMKSAAGYPLTRRENLQLKRTTQDIVRLVPFAAFLIIPFAELLLPFALKLFPNLLPSTYESSKKRENKLENLRNTRKLMSEIIKNNKSHFKPNNISEEQKALFNRFYTHVRATGVPESRQQLIEVARLFTDDTVLDNVTRPYLIALAKYMNLQPFGTDVMLRYRIRYKMLELKKKMIYLYITKMQNNSPSLN